ncbi:MAG: ABC transporter permease, partial [Tepidisphaeraceae bacterium]
TTPLSPRKPLMVIKPTRGWAALNLSEVWHFKDLLLSLAGRDVKLRYRQTILGVAWVLLQPLLAAGIFSFVFGVVARLPSDGVPYFAFTFAGMLAWNAFSSTLSKTSGCLVGHAQLVSKVYFPRLVLPLSTIFSTLIDSAVAMGMMAILMAVYGIVPGWGIVLLPVWFALALMLAVGMGLYACALAVTYRDVPYILPVLLQVMLYASPIAYALSAVPEKLRGFYLINPLSGLLEAFRWSLLNTGSLPVLWVAYSAVVSVALFIGGAFAFRKLERKFADVI